jgi:hypothetical protein
MCRGRGRLKKLDKKNKRLLLLLPDRRIRVGEASGPGTLCMDSEMG